jgi:mannosyltransferase OCH1-like enzyme
MNPNWHYKLWDRTSVEHLIASTPEHWQTTFRNLEHWVEQCDFAYVIIYILGGIYTILIRFVKRQLKNLPSMPMLLLLVLKPM